MKRKDLYNQIREDIISTLSEDTALVTSKAGTNSVSYAKSDDLNNLKDDSNVSSITTTSGQKIKEDFAKTTIQQLAKVRPGDKIIYVGPSKDGFSGTREYEVKSTSSNSTFQPTIVIKNGNKLLKISDPKYVKLGSNLDEMARKANNLKIGDPEKFKDTKELYEGGWEAKLLDLISEAGEAGISQASLATALGINNSAVINPTIREFTSIGAIAPSRIKSVEPETDEPENTTEPSTSEPAVDMDADVEVKDDWEKPEDEPEEKEPTAADVKSVEPGLEKSNAKELSPEDEEKYTKLKKGVDAKMVKLRAMPKGKRGESDDMKVLKQIIGREDVKKLFRTKGVDLKGLIASI